VVVAGGVLECGESLRDAVAREALEETGLLVEPVEMLGVYERVIRSDEGRVRYHYVLIDFLCRAIGGELKAGSDAADVRWFTHGELPGSIWHTTRMMSCARVWSGRDLTLSRAILELPR